MGYGLFLAKIVGTCPEYTEDIGDRLQVRILPYMESIEASKCPIWPFFFRDQIYTGRTGELVWVVCDDEFSTGYIMGPANYTTYEMDSYGAQSIPKELRDTLGNVSVKLKGESISFADVKVTYWSKFCVHMIRRSDGASIIAYSNGTLYFIGPEELLINIGGFSLKADSKGLSVNSETLKLQSGYIGLGPNPVGNVLVTTGSSSEGGSISKYVKA